MTETNSECLAKRRRSVLCGLDVRSGAGGLDTLGNSDDGVLVRANALVVGSATGCLGGS
jgi:hypothetical protein